jgi:nucleotide-binding universal stress UspA family protein
MTRDILVVSDLTMAAGHALWRAAHLARAHAATLRLLHVQPPSGDAAAAQAALDELAQAVQQRLGVAVQVAMVQGDLVREAMRAAQAADLLVLPARQAHTLRERTFGTSTERLVRASRIPALVVGRPLPLARDSTLPSPGRQHLYERVLVCMALAADGDDVIAAASALSADPRMEVFHAVQPQRPRAGARAANEANPGTSVEFARAALRQRIALAGAAAHGVRAAVGFGAAGASIVVKERAIGAELVVIGRRPRGLLGNFSPLGEVAREVLAQTRCDVLLVPRQPRAAPADSASTALPDRSALG